MTGFKTVDVPLWGMIARVYLRFGNEGENVRGKFKACLDGRMQKMFHFQRID